MCETFTIHVHYLHQKGKVVPTLFEFRDRSTSPTKYEVMITLHNRLLGPPCATRSRLLLYTREKNLYRRIYDVTRYVGGQAHVYVMRVPYTFPDEYELEAFVKEYRAIQSVKRRSEELFL